MVEFLKEDDIPGRLQNLDGALVEHAWNAAEKTAGVWIDVLPLGDVRVVLEDVIPPRLGPRLIRDLPVRRIDDQTRFVDPPDRKSTRLNSSHLGISYAVFCLKKKKKSHAQVLAER